MSHPLDPFVRISPLNILILPHIITLLPHVNLMRIGPISILIPLNPIMSYPLHLFVRISPLNILIYGSSEI